MKTIESVVIIKLNEVFRILKKRVEKTGNLIIPISISVEIYD